MTDIISRRTKSNKLSVYVSYKRSVELGSSRPKMASWKLSLNIHINCFGDAYCAGISFSPPQISPSHSKSRTSSYSAYGLGSYCSGLEERKTRKINFLFLLLLPDDIAVENGYYVSHSMWFVATVEAWEPIRQEFTPKPGPHFISNEMHLASTSRKAEWFFLSIAFQTCYVSCFSPG